MPLLPGEKIRAARTAKRPPWSQYDLAKESGVSRSAIANYETGRTGPPEAELAKIARALGIDPSWFREGPDELTVEYVAPGPNSIVAERRAQYMPSTEAKGTVPIPVIGAIGAGEESGSDEEPRVLYVPAEFAGQDHGAFPLEGNSMLPYLHPGDTLIFKLTYQPRIGRVNAVICPGDSKPVAKQVALRDGDLRIESFNDAYEAVASDGVRFLGFLIGIDGDNLRMGPIWDGIGKDYIERELRSRLP
jgi:transcriptional regulator with XRE-family HTH domain